MQDNMHARQQNWMFIEHKYTQNKYCPTHVVVNQFSEINITPNVCTLFPVKIPQRVNIYSVSVPAIDAFNALIIYA